MLLLLNCLYYRTHLTSDAHSKNSPEDARLTFPFSNANGKISAFELFKKFGQAPPLLDKPDPEDGLVFFVKQLLINLYEEKWFGPPSELINKPFKSLTKIIVRSSIILCNLKIDAYFIFNDKPYWQKGFAYPVKHDRRLTDEMLKMHFVHSVHLTGIRMQYYPNRQLHSLHWRITVECRTKNVEQSKGTIEPKDKKKGKSSSKATDSKSKPNAQGSSKAKGKQESIFIVVNTIPIEEYESKNLNKSDVPTEMV